MQCVFVDICDVSNAGRFFLTELHYAQCAQKQKVKEEQRLKYKLGVEADEAKARKKQLEVDAYRASLRVDIGLKKQRHAAEAQVLVEERKEMALANEKFDANLKAVMGSHYQPPEHYRKKKVQWYF